MSRCRTSAPCRPPPLRRRLAQHVDSPLIETRPQVVFLGEPASFDAALVGAKAASLGLLAADFPVPPGFCLTSEVFARFAANAETSMAEIRALVAPAYERLAHGGSPRVAVRSSAIGEDGGAASFAGQHDTYLDLTGVDAVVDAVVRCWASLRNERALAYRERQGLDAGGVMPVLVQRLVPADAAAVAFSADPLTGDRGAVRINVARGLGEALVSGNVTPDVYLVAKEPLAIRARTMAGDAPALDEGTVLEIARLAVALERRMGHPVDVECAVVLRSVHVVQCRPITTLPEPFEVRWPEPSFERMSWGRDFPHAPEPVPPLSAEMFLIAHPAMGDANTHFGSPFRSRSLVMNGYIYTAQELLAEDDDELAARLAAARDKRRAFGRKLPEFWERKILPYLREFYAWIAATPVATASGAEAAEIWEECWSRLLRVWQLHFYVVGTAYPVLDELASQYEELFPRRRGIDALALTQGLTNDVQDMQADLFDVAETARTEGESLPEFRALLGGFLQRHGHLGHTHNDLRQPAWADEPERVIEEVRKRVARPVEDPRVRRRRALAVAADLEARIRRDLADRPDDLARFEEVLAAARGVAPLTEGHNYELDRRSQTLLRRFVLRVGERLVRVGAIDAAAHVFYLDRREVAETLVEERDRRALVAERAAELARQTRM
ncbi:MAG: PEP/pyruvate-binding domain-containing protein, partial [Candidatus Limnocylindria bacterium]